MLSPGITVRGNKMACHLPHTEATARADSDKWVGRLSLAGTLPQGLPFVALWGRGDGEGTRGRKFSSETER